MAYLPRLVRQEFILGAVGRPCVTLVLTVVFLVDRRTPNTHTGRAEGDPHLMLVKERGGVMTSKNADKAQADGDFRYFLLAVRTGTDFIETATLSAAEIPLAVMSTLGVSTDTTDSARGATRDLAHGVHGTVDSIAEQIASAVSKQVSLAGDIVSSTGKPAAKG